MKAVRFHRHGDAGVLQLEEVPAPAPEAGQVLVRVTASGVNYADTVRRWGDHYPIPTPLPFIAGGEVAGVVEAVGPGVSRAWMGQRVLGAPPAGGYAEVVAVNEGAVFALPDGLDAHQGLALFIQGLSAALILRESARLRPGESVFVEGASGGVGSLGVQLARLYGAGTVIGAASSAAKRAQVLERGADHALDYTVAGWSQELKRLTGEHGADVVMEMTGGEVFREALQVLAPGGRIVVYGVASRKPYPVPSERLIARGQSVIGFFLGLHFRHRTLIDATLAELAQFVQAGRLRADIGGVYPLAEAAEVHRLLESRQSTAKLILVP